MESALRVTTLSETMAGVDEPDQLLLELMVQNPLRGYKELAEAVNVDQRTVAKRIKSLASHGVFTRH